MGSRSAIGWTCSRPSATRNTWRWWPGSKPNTAWGMVMPMRWLPIIWQPLKAPSHAQSVEPGKSGSTVNLPLPYPFIQPITPVIDHVSPRNHYPRQLAPQRPRLDRRHPQRQHRKPSNGHRPGHPAGGAGSSARTCA
ncbi:hypothetical protein EMIT0P74_110124 [Pseudomonas sp. IT-P74]